MRLPRLLGAVVLVAACALVVPAYADANDDAQDHYDNGIGLYKQKKYQEAAGEFMAAYNINAAGDFLFNAAVCFEKMKDYPEAIKLFQRYLDEAPKAGDKQRIEERIKGLKEMMAGGKNVAPPKEITTRGIVIIESTPPGATIYLDDKKNGSLGETPWNGPIEGEHTIIIEAKGYKTVKDPITAAPDKLLRLKYGLSEEHYLGWIEVRSNVVGADVFIDERESGAVGKTPYLGNIPPGKHKIIVTREGFTEDSREMEIEAGKAHKIEVHLTKEAAGFIHVAGQGVENAQVRLDGKIVCEKAPCRFKSPAGDHTVKVQRDGLKSYERKLTVVAATETQLSVKLMPKESRTDVIWNFAFAALFVGGGVVAGLHSNSIYDDLQKSINAGAPPVSPNDSRFLEGKLWAGGADVLYVVGTITAVTGIISLLREKGPVSTGTAETKELGIMPVIGPNYAGVRAEVRW